MHTALNIEAPVIYEELYSIHGDRALCPRIVEQWCKQFREGQEKLEDETRPDRPITETAENIDQVRLIIEDDPCVTREEVQNQTSVS